MGISDPCGVPTITIIVFERTPVKDVYLLPLRRHSGESRNPGKSTISTPACTGVTDLISASLNDVIVQVSPLRIYRLDKRKFPVTSPFLERFLARNGGLHRLVRFEPDQGVHVVLLCEACHEIVLMLPNALNKIGRHASIERTVLAAGEDIDTWQLHGRSLLDSGFRRNDGVIDGVEMGGFGTALVTPASIPLPTGLRHGGEQFLHLCHLGFKV
jgi:hypothetical protein